MATRGQQAEQNMSAADLAALKAAGDKYNAATTDAERQAAHAEAEAIRANYGYSGGANGAGYTEVTKTGNGRKDTTAGTGQMTPPVTMADTAAPQQSYYIRDGQRVATNFVDGHNVNADGSAITWQPGDISVTPGGQYYIIGDNGAARQVTADNTNDVLTLMNALGTTDGYTPKGNATQLNAQQSFETWLQSDPARWNQYLTLALEWNSANTRGDTATANAIHRQMENFRNQYGHAGGKDGTATRVVNPDAIPAELQEAFAPLIAEYNQQIMADPDYLSSPDGQLMLAEIGKYPDFVRAVIASAPTSSLALNLQAVYPQYTVGEGVEDMQGLDYAAKYMPEYWEKFQNEYDPERFASDYDAIRQQLIEANQAGVDLGRLKLEAQLENAMPEYDKLRRANELQQAKAANNMALYNAANGDLGGIGARQYSLEQNAYDQRMMEIRLEQQNLINTTNQQIAQLEAEGRMQEAQILAEWGQAKLNAMQEQYNQYWNMYQQGAAAMENLEYGIASDEWDRAYQLRQDKLNEQLNKYKADVDAYNAALQRAQLDLAVDESNRDYDYNRWLAETNNALQLANLENAYNADKYQAAVDQQKLQLSVDEANRDYEYERWLNDRNFQYQLNRDEVSDQRYDTEWEEQLREVAFDNAIKKLSMGMLSGSDVEALGVPKDQAQTYADRVNLMAQIDEETAKAQLTYLKAQIGALNAKTYGSGSGSGRGSGSGSGGGGDDTSLFYKLLASGVTPDSKELWDALYSAGYTSEWKLKQQMQYYSNLYNQVHGVEEPTSILDKLYTSGATPDNLYSSMLDLGLKADYDTLLGDYAPYYENRSTEEAAQKEAEDAYKRQVEALLWGANNDPLMQNILSLTPEDVANKKTTTTTSPVVKNTTSGKNNNIQKK